MLLIYTDKISDRLNYILHFVFKEQMGIDFMISTNIEACKLSDKDLINYSNESINNARFQIKPHTLLFEEGIKPQQIDCFETDGYKAFFKTSASDFQFDIFAASFYLLSRYEEYLPHEKDIYGRYSHENSLAFKNNFLHKPLINIWINDLTLRLKTAFENIIFHPPVFKAILTYDIDIAWSYQHKGFFRNIGGFIKNPGLERLSVMLRIKKDPFDAYDFIDKLHEQKQLSVLYFFLVADNVSKYDKNISPNKASMRELIKAHSNKYPIGLHPSWKSNNNITILKKEKAYLEEIANKQILNSRQHYIQFSLPDSFEKLIKAGINNDFSMGYGSINGFRASFAGSFYWYNLAAEKTTRLKLFPFCFMDANSHYEQHQNTKDAFAELMHYKNECEKVNGLFISIFHNNFLGTDKKFNGWKEMYEAFISQLPQ